METVKHIRIPVIADSVLSPDVLYDESVAIYFITEDDKYGRITFEHLDAIKICRGEYLPYEYDWDLWERDIWVYEIQNSAWQQERYHYEKKHYGSAYEFGGNVEEMLNDFKHLLFSFHDQFVEVITKGFWFEESDESLFKKPLTEGHPFLPLPFTDMQTIEAHSLVCQVRVNPKPVETLVKDSEFCSQKLYEFALDLDGKATVSNTVLLSRKDGKLISSLRGFFGRKTVDFEGVATIDQVKPYIEKYMGEVYTRRVKYGLE